MTVWIFNGQGGGGCRFQAIEKKEALVWALFSDKLVISIGLLHVMVVVVMAVTVIVVVMVVMVAMGCTETSHRLVDHSWLHVLLSPEHPLGRSHHPSSVDHL